MEKDENKSKPKKQKKFLWTSHILIDYENDPRTPLIEG
tara:strand:- start:227 stop:340 length:114 start_codon:yes stop_codon:yes gene_type:complete